MAQYVRRVVAVEAFRLGFELPPDWFTEAIAEERVRIVASDHCVIVREAGTFQHAWFGDMVVHSGQYIWGVEHDVFADLYEEVQSG